MILTNYALNMLGFDKILEENPIEARFHSLNVYKVRGITANSESALRPETLKRTTSVISASIGDSVNEVCRALTGGDFAENEEEWRNEKKTTPPYLMVLTSLPESAICTTGYWKNESDAIVTYGCFTTSREALVQLEKDKTTSFVTALSACLSTPEHPVLFIPIAREVYGVTPDNRTVRDIWFTGSAELTVSKVFSSDMVASGIEAALTASENIHSKIGYFFDLAIRETDSLKKFLYYFLVIEVHTHQVFKTFDYSTSFSVSNNIPKRIEDEATNLLFTYPEDAKNLTTRFIWCSSLKWKDMTDADINQFKLIKKIRDRIYHGEDVDMRALPLIQAQKLTLKILKNKF
jgi:hypothetical protein